MSALKLVRRLLETGDLSAKGGGALEHEAAVGESEGVGGDEDAAGSPELAFGESLAWWSSAGGRCPAGGCEMDFERGARPTVDIRI